jgi:signal transduction histidine kinase
LEKIEYNKKIRWGITWKITASLLCVVLFTLVMSISALFFFGRFKQNYRSLSDQNIPASIAAAKLMKLAHRLMAYEPIIVLADNQLIRESLTIDLLDDIRQSHQLLACLRASSIAENEVEDITRHFAFLTDTLNRLIDISNRDARIVVEQHQVLSRLRELSKALQDSSPADRNLTQTEKDEYTRLNNHLYHQISILLHLHFETDATAIAEWEQEFVSFSQRTDILLQQRPDLTKTALSRYKAEIDSYGKGNRDSFAQRLEQIKIQNKIQENLVQDQFISFELGRHIDTLFTAILKEADESWHQIERLMDYLSILSLVLPLIVSLLGMVVYIYMRNSVINRIKALEESMRSYSSGGSSIINTDGGDEITSMAKSVLYFVHTRDQYETSLNRAIVQTAEATQKIACGDLSARVEVLDKDPTRYLSLSFNQMADRIESLINSQRHLFQAVSHELRTPLSRIAFHLEMISQENDLGQRDHLVTEISNEMDEIDNLVKELLIYSKFSSHPIKLAVQSIELRSALNRIITRQKTTNKRFIEIDIFTSTKEDIEVTAQPFYFKLAIQNLLSNAVHYAFHKVWIRYYRVAKGVCIEVCDDGPGIPEESRHIVFEPFTRLDCSRDRKTGGVGLGLAIVNRILERHGGKVSICDNNGHGSRFITFWPSKRETLEAQHLTPDAECSMS